MRLRHTAIFGIILSVLLLAAEAEAKAKKPKNKTTAIASPKIVGGTMTTISKLKYLVNLREYGEIICGGTLVTKYFVVTAGHCVKGIWRSALRVVGGQTRLSTGGVYRRVAKIMIPSGFNMRSLHMDVAVLKLSSPMTGTNILPIGLCNKAWKVGDLLRVSGWGLTQGWASKEPDIVRTVSVPLMNRYTCARRYRGEATLTSTMFCASVLGKRDACDGDSGGPVVYNGRLCGIVSWGFGCASNRYPGVYTNVRKVMTFIKNSLKK